MMRQLLCFFQFCGNLGNSLLFCKFLFLYTISHWSVNYQKEL